MISHTSMLMEEKQERLCIRILTTLRAMMAVDPEYGEKVRDLVECSITTVLCI